MKTTFLFSLILGCLPLAASELPAGYTKGPLIYQDDFKEDKGNWQSELESGGSITFKDAALDIDVPSGASVWLKQVLDGPLLVEYDATVVMKGGANDRLSDLNCFWMAQDSRSPDNLFATPRSGKFSDYNLLRTYYVGQGGNTNTTTRFRRYIGNETLRPLLPEHDLKGPEHLLKANESQKIEIIAADSTIQYFRNGVLLFNFQDPEPYRRGWFAFRTVHSHLVIKNFRIYRLLTEKPNS